MFGTGYKAAVEWVRADGGSERNLQGKVFPRHQSDCRSGVRVELNKTGNWGKGGLGIILESVLWSEVDKRKGTKRK